MTRPNHLPVRELAKLFRRFWPQIRSEKKLLAIAALGLVGEVVMRLLEPWPLKFVLDSILAKNDGRPALPAFLADATPVTLVTVAAIALVAVGLLRALSSYANTVGLALVGNRVLTQVRADLYRHMQALSLSFHSQARGGELIVRIINDVGMLKDVTVSAMLPFLTNILMVTGMFAVMLWLDWRLALLALSTVPIFWLRTASLTRRLHKVAREQRRREGAMAATAAESIGAIRVVKALSLEESFSRAFSAQNTKSLLDGAKATKLEAGLERSVDALIAISSALVLWYGARLALTGQLTAGGLIVFLTYLKNAFKPVRDFAKYTNRLTKGAAAGERVLELLDQVPEVRDDPGAVAAPAFTGTIRFERVRFAYESGNDVLHEIDLSIAAGDRVAVVGESGAGKSTIASLILRLYDPTAGRILIDGHDIRGFKVASLRSQISVVLQDTLLFRGTIAENIALGAPDVPMEKIVEAARIARAENFIEKSPRRYHTIVGERGVTLSSGQRQRIAIARAAVRCSPIVLLDEPTTGLDEENRRAVGDALEQLTRGKTTIVITHDLELARLARRIMFLDAGRITESGTHEELVALNGRYAAAYRSQRRNDAPDLHHGPRARIA